LLRIALCVPFLLTTLARPGTATAASHPVMRGADVSWPNCPKGEGIPSRRSKGEPMPKSSARFVVVGVTNGPGFHPNPCIARQLAWVADHDRLVGAYALTTYPTAKRVRQYGHSGPFEGTDHKAELRNTGYAEAAYNVSTMDRFGLQVPLIWVDVEPYPVAPWNHRHGANRAVITGVIRGYRDAGLRVGIYTYANGWRDVVGAWRLPSYPTWSTAGHRGERRARAMCTHGPSAGPTWLAQWSSPHRDYDLTCPKASPHYGAMFGGLTAGD
jgi:hypothetical protein